MKAVPLASGIYVLLTVLGIGLILVLDAEIRRAVARRDRAIAKLAVIRDTEERVP